MGFLVTWFIERRIHSNQFIHIIHHFSWRESFDDFTSILPTDPEHLDILHLRMQESSHEHRHDNEEKESKQSQFRAMLFAFWFPPKERLFLTHLRSTACT